MPQVDFEDIIEAIVQDVKPIVFVDTCIYLDLIRLFPRNKLDSKIIQACKKLANDLLSQENSFWLLTANMVEKEWHDNSEKALKESDMWFKDLERKVNRVKSIAPHIPTISSNYTYQLYSNSLGQYLFDLSKSLLDQTNVINHIDRLSDHALRRVYGNIMPSGKGKSEIKDCYIFEVFLELSRELRGQDITESIYFLTSNKNDFGSPSDEDSRIIHDLNSVNADYINNWLWLQSVLIPGK